MTSIEDYDLAEKIRKIHGDAASLKKFLMPIPGRHMDSILVQNGFHIVRARSKQETFSRTCPERNQITLQLARQLFDAREAGKFRQLKSGGKIALVKGAPFTTPVRQSFERKLNDLIPKNDVLSSFKRNYLFTIPEMTKEKISFVLAYSNEPRNFEEWIYNILVLETVSRARYVLDPKSGRISFRGQFQRMVEEGLKIVCQALTGESSSFEYLRFSGDQIRKLVDDQKEPVNEIVFETTESLGFIDQITLRGFDVDKGLDLLKEQGIDLKKIGKLIAAGTPSFRVTSDGEVKEQRGDQSVLPDFA